MSEPIAGVGYLAGSCQYDGSAWRKSNLLWGYNTIWDENLGGTATGATYYKDTSTIPAGELWVLQAISARNLTRNPASVFLRIGRASGSVVGLIYTVTPGAGVPVLATGQWVLRTGDVARVYLSGCQVDDVIEAGIVGYKMKLDM